MLTLQNWCVKSPLEINVSQTKELILQNSKDFMQPVMINGQMVEMVDVFKYLGLFIDSNITFKENTVHN